MIYILHMVSFHSHVLLNYPGAQNCIKSNFEVVRGQKKLHNNFLAHPFLWVHDGARAPRKHLKICWHDGLFTSSCSQWFPDALGSKNRSKPAFGDGPAPILPWNQPTWQRNRLMALAWDGSGSGVVFPCFPMFSLVMSGKMMSLDHCLGFGAATFLAKAVAMGLHFWTSIHTS